jgi:hypothetical protein
MKLRIHSKRHTTKTLPMIFQLDIRSAEVQVPDKGSLLSYHPEDGFALFVTGFSQLSGGELRQTGTERPLYAHTDRRMVEARAQYHLARKMRKAYRLKDVIIQMKPDLIGPH